MTEPDGGTPFEPAGEGAGSWWWQPADEAGVALDRPMPRFASQRVAEDWLGENFAELAEDGVTAVSLFDGERLVYGPMPLTP
jgi:hypothetical protein